MRIIDGFPYSNSTIRFIFSENMEKVSISMGALLYIPCADGSIDTCGEASAGQHRMPRSRHQPSHMPICLFHGHDVRVANLEVDNSRGRSLLCFRPAQEERGKVPVCSNEEELSSVVPASRIELTTFGMRIHFY
jgi:hypothetical protein